MVVKRFNPVFQNVVRNRNSGKDKSKMDLFNTGSIINLLPRDGEAIYHQKVLQQKEATFYMQKLLDTVEWRNDELVIFSKLITTKRKVAWYGDLGYSYTYSNTTKQALAWTEELKQLKKIAEERSGTTFNSCLLNLYHNGHEGMSWHSDDEKSIEKNSTIASMSFGAERKFCFKHKTTKEAASLILENGSLLVMKGTVQTNWLHSLPKSKRITQPRINLTFRTMVKDSVNY